MPRLPRLSGRLVFLQRDDAIGPVNIGDSKVESVKWRRLQFQQHRRWPIAKMTRKSQKKNRHKPRTMERSAPMATLQSETCRQVAASASLMSGEGGIL